jgi:drug/metabolite transporter (DMT)-like permease
MTSQRIVLLSMLALSAFAANSVLARLALLNHEIGPWSFTGIRLISGALVLVLIAGPRQSLKSGDWPSALSLIAYAGFFSFAYLALPTATGALILFMLVQITMLGTGIGQGERLNLVQWGGVLLAISGLVFLLGPGIRAPSFVGALAMALAGIAWGIYSLRGRGAQNPTRATAGNFVKAALMAALLSVPVFMVFPEAMPNAKGILLALASGIVTSGLGYTIWYMALKGLSATRAGIAQLSVPVLAALGGVMVVGEPLTLRFVLSSFMTLGGIALVIVLTEK